MDIKIISGGVYLSGLLLCMSNPTANEPTICFKIGSFAVGLVLVIMSLPVLIGSLGGLDD